MKKNYPRRVDSHMIENVSEVFFLKHLPTNWTCERLRHDYGIDLRVEIFEGEFATGYELIVQLKASHKSTKGDTERIRLKTSTYNYLWDKLQVVMLVKFIKSENKAYWLLLKDVPSPRQDNTTFTVHIPRSYRLDKIDWKDILSYISEVSNIKLSARRNQN
jgi:hypothetical protein